MNCVSWKDKDRWNSFVRNRTWSSSISFVSQTLHPYHYFWPCMLFLIYSQYIDSWAIIRLKGKWIVMLLHWQRICWWWLFCKILRIVLFVNLSATVETLDVYLVRIVTRFFWAVWGTRPAKSITRLEPRFPEKSYSIYTSHLRFPGGIERWTANIVT